MKLDLRITAGDSVEGGFRIKLDAEDVIDDDMAFTLAAVVHSFGLIERDGVAGAAGIAGKAIAIAEVMHRYKDDENYFVDLFNAVREGMDN